MKRGGRNFLPRSSSSDCCDGAPFFIRERESIGDGRCSRTRNAIKTKNGAVIAILLEIKLLFKEVFICADY